MKTLLMLLVIVTGTHEMTDFKNIIRLLKEIPPPENNRTGMLSDGRTNYRWIGPLRTPPGLCLSGKHRVTGFSLELSRTTSRSRKVTYTFGSLELHNILLHSKKPDTALIEFFR